MTRTRNEPVASLTGLVARDVMTRHLATVAEGGSVREALTTMRRWGVRHLPVTEHGCFVGLVDDRLVNAALRGDADGRALDQPVGEVMSRYVPQVGPDASLARVAHLLRTSRSDAVAVIDEQEHLLGLITLVDVVGTVAE